jgi:hypothetical protein
MSRLQCYGAFVKAAKDIGVQHKWIADGDWVSHIQNQNGLKDCSYVSHINYAI